MNTESSGTNNPQPTVEDPVEPMHYAVGGRRPLASSGRSHADPNKSYKFHGKRRQLDMSIQLQPVNNQGTLLDLARPLDMARSNRKMGKRCSKSMDDQSL